MPTLPKIRVGRVLHQVECMGSLGLNFDYDGGLIIENGGPIFLYICIIIGFVLVIIKSRYTRLKEMTRLVLLISTGLSCHTGVAKHQVKRVECACASFFFLHISKFPLPGVMIACDRASRKKRSHFRISQPFVST